jgi:HlyD family secretion protein
VPQVSPSSLLYDGPHAPREPGEQVWVLPVDGSGTPVAVAVTPGISDGHLTEITSGELKEGMLVITDQKTSTAK